MYNWVTDWQMWDIFQNYTQLRTEEESAESDWESAEFEFSVA